MLCPRCFTPLPPASARDARHCARCGHLAADQSSAPSSSSSYSLAMATAIKGDRPDTQPSVPIAIPFTPGSVSSSRHASVRPWEGTIRPERASAARPAATPAAVRRPALVAEPYTLALLVADTFGINPAPAALRHGRTRLTWVQRLLVAGLGARLAATKRAPALAGGIFATLVGLGLMLLVQLGSSALLAATFAPGGTDPVTHLAEATVRTLLGGSALQLFALANLLPVLLMGAPSGAHMQLTPPLTTLALIPMLALVLGGALAGASDFTRRARYSVARGALIGPVYAVLLTALTVLVGGRVEGSPLGLDGTVTLIAAPQTALFYGLLWGCLCGAAGGWLQLYGWRSRRAARARLARLRFRRLLGVCVGAVTALSAGLGASFAVAVAGLVYMLVSGQVPQQLAGVGQAMHLGGTQQGILGLALLALVLAPSLAIWVFALASGMPLGLDLITYAPPSPLGSNFVSPGLAPFLGATQMPPQPVWYLLALIPLVCYFLGGRAAVCFAGARSRRSAFVTGALTAVPLALGLLLLCSMASVSAQAMLPSGALIAGAGPSALPGVLVVFAVAAVVAGLGGRSAFARDRARSRRADVHP